MSTLPRALTALPPPSPHHPPLDPTAAQAREQLARELAKAQYQAARPNPLDQVIQKIEDWFNSLFTNTSGGFLAPGVIILIVVVVVIAAILVGFLVFGVPRLNRRSAAAGALFGTEDDRTSDTLLRSAERAAAIGDFALAIAEGFRSIARGLDERGVSTTFPGTTAHSFALQAAIPFPTLGAELSRAADIFDGVRYLGAAGAEQDWLAIRSLERDVRGTSPKRELQHA